MASPTTSQPNPAQPGSGVSLFDTVLRGYERRQVDEYVIRKDDEVTRLRGELGEMSRQRRLATEHAEATEKELRDLKMRSAHVQPASPEDSFGFRAEKLLRMAEHEAAETRTNASRESTSILEKARTEAERHRHEAEQSLIARASQLEQQSAQRAVELQERETQIADQLAAAREQAEEVHAAAARAADRLREESEAAATEVRVRSEAAAQRQKQQAEQEITRLSRLQSDVRGELSRLAEVLSNELSGQAAPRGQKPASDGKVPSSSPSGEDRGRAAAGGPRQPR